VLALGRAVRRPIARIASALKSVKEGELEFPSSTRPGHGNRSGVRGIHEMSLPCAPCRPGHRSFHGELNDPVYNAPCPTNGSALQSASTISRYQCEPRNEEGDCRARHSDSLTAFSIAERSRSSRTHLASARRSRGARSDVLFIDLDKLKEINDTLGHDGGDDAIRAWRTPTSSDPASDVIARSVAMNS